MARIDSFDDQQFIKIISSSKSMSDVRRALGYGTSGGQPSQLVRQRAKGLGLSLDHLKYIPTTPPPNKERRLEQVFVQCSDYRNNVALKNKVIKYDLIPYACQKCGNDGMWLGNELKLQLHHRNGKHSDNRIANLCFLCPNCHSQTQNYAGKNKTTTC